MPKTGKITLVGPLTVYPNVYLLHELLPPSASETDASNLRVRCFEVVEATDTTKLQPRDLINERLYELAMEGWDEQVVCRPAKSAADAERYATQLDDWKLLTEPDAPGFIRQRG